MDDCKEQSMYHRGMADALEGKERSDLDDEKRCGLGSLVDSYNKGFRDGLEKRLESKRPMGPPASRPARDQTDAEIDAINAERFEYDLPLLDRRSYQRMMDEIGADYEAKYGFDPGEK